MPYGRNQGQGQGHSREVDRQSPTGLILFILDGYKRSSARGLFVLFMYLPLLHICCYLAVFL